MARFEYKVVPAPRRGLKARGVKGTEAQFANALATLMNEVAAHGWEYQRTDSLPCEERKGLTGRITVFQNMLVFRRALAVAVPAAAGQHCAPLALAVPVAVPSLTAPAPSVVAPEVKGPLMLMPDPRTTTTLTRGAAAGKPCVVQTPDASRGPSVAAE